MVAMRRGNQGVAGGAASSEGDAEGRVKALVSEMGDVRDDLRREIKRREKAVALCKLKTEALASAEARERELKLSHQSTSGKLATAERKAKEVSGKHHRDLHKLRVDLDRVEGGIRLRSKRTLALLQHVFRALDTLHHVLLPEMEHRAHSLQISACFASLIENLTELNGMHGADPIDDPERASTAPSAPTDRAPSDPTDDLRAQLERASREAEELREENARLMRENGALVEERQAQASTIADLEAVRKNQREDICAALAAMAALQPLRAAVMSRPEAPPEEEEEAGEGGEGGEGEETVGSSAALAFEDNFDFDAGSEVAATASELGGDAPGLASLEEEMVALTREISAIKESVATPAPSLAG